MKSSHIVTTDDVKVYIVFADKENLNHSNPLHDYPGEFLLTFYPQPGDTIAYLIQGDVKMIHVNNQLHQIEIDIESESFHPKHNFGTEADTIEVHSGLEHSSLIGDDSCEEDLFPLLPKVLIEHFWEGTNWSYAPCNIVAHTYKDKKGYSERQRKEIKRKNHFFISIDCMSDKVIVETALQKWEDNIEAQGEGLEIDLMD